MKFWQQPRTLLVLVILVVGFLTLQQIWHWEVERIEVPLGKFLIRISRWGKDLGPDEIIAPSESYKGVMFEPWPKAGTSSIRIFWSYEVHEMVKVPAGAVPGADPQVRQAAVGRAHRSKATSWGPKTRANPIDGERGILRDVLTQGNYRLNRYAYSWERVPAVEVRVDQVGVRTLKVGKDPRTLERDVELGHYLVPRRLSWRAATTRCRLAPITSIPTSSRSRRSKCAATACG